MKTRDLLIICIACWLGGVIFGSGTQKYLDHEPFFVFPVDTITVYEDTLYVEMFKSYYNKSWTEVSQKYKYINVLFEGDRANADTVTLKTIYHTRR